MPEHNSACMLYSMHVQACEQGNYMILVIVEHFKTISVSLYKVVDDQLYTERGI